MHSLPWARARPRAVHALAPKTQMCMHTHTHNTHAHMLARTGQIIGVGASVVGDMSSRPNWGLNELDFVFATLVVGSVVNFRCGPLGGPGAGAGRSVCAPVC